MYVVIFEAPIELYLNWIIGTGEHGVGVGKREYLVDELGENTVELMRTVKDALDPLNIMNPGKVNMQWGPLLKLFHY